MKRTAVLFTIGLVGCGGGDGMQTPDAPFNQMPNYDLSCMTNNVPGTASTVPVAGTLYDQTNLAMRAELKDIEIKATAVATGTMLGTTMTDPDGKYGFDIPTSGQALRVRYEVHATGLMATYSYNSTPVFKAITMGSIGTVAPSRADGLATALGATRDPSKGVLEVQISDCSASGFPSATVAVANENVQWAMYGGVGAWLPRPTTVSPPNGWAYSIAGAVNVSPGPHSLTVTSGNVSIGPVTFDTAADTWTVVYVIPGVIL